MPEAILVWMFGWSFAWQAGKSGIGMVPIQHLAFISICYQSGCCSFTPASQQETNRLSTAPDLPNMTAALADDDSVVGLGSTRAATGQSLLGSACHRLAHAPGASSNNEVGSSSSKKRRLVGSAAIDACNTAVNAAADSAATTAVGNAGLRVLLTTEQSAADRSAKAAAAADTANVSRILSSIAMDLAHSLALSASDSAAPSNPHSCRGCRGCCGDGSKEKESARPSSSSSSASVQKDGGDANIDKDATRAQQHHQKQCRCVDVVYILHESNISAGGEEDDDEAHEHEDAELFPLRCRKLGPMSEDHDNSAGDVEEQDGGGCGWDETALSRIQVRYVKDGADLVQYLASLQLLPPSEQPLGGIVLDDAAKFVKSPLPAGTAGSSSLGSSYFTIDSAIALTQILALLANTADYLEQRRRKLLAPLSEVSNTVDTSFALLVTMDGGAYSQLPPHAKTLLQNFLPTLGTVRRVDDGGSGKNGGDASSNQELAAGAGNNDGGGWALDLKREGWRLPSCPPFGPIARRGAVKFEVGYSEEDSPDGMPEILWRESGNDSAR